MVHVKTIHKRQGELAAMPSRRQSQKTLPEIHRADVPRSPHRRLQNESATALGVGRAFTRIPILIEKPIVRSPRPADFNDCLRADIADAARTCCNQSSAANLRHLPSIVCDDQIDALSTKRIYTSTTRQSSEEAALPTPRIEPPLTTLERDADPVRCRRAVRYAPRPAAWQRYAREWDAMQLRKSAVASKLPQIGYKGSENSKVQETQKESFKFLRPMPGYGGFVPRHAVAQSDHPETDCISDSMCSTSRRTYRSFPTYEYKVLEHAHKGPFSKTVTMTHPLNPFNKVEHQLRIY